MQTEIMMIGTELLLGQIQDTNAAFIARTLAEQGINLYQKTTVGDNRARIAAALDAALKRSDVVLCSGGLGPTEDDITRECVAELLGRPLEYHPALFESILSRFSHLRIRITENNKKQATLPRGAEAIENPNGTAPGVLVEDARGTIICMPGVPLELEAMLVDRVLPYLRARFGLAGVLHSRVLKVCGLGESRIDSLMGDLVNSQANPTVGLLASPDAVRIRITARAEHIPAAEALIDPVEQAIQARLPGLIMGRDAETLESVVDRLLEERGWTLALAETQTGGMMAQRLTAAGARSFVGGRVIPQLSEGASGREHALDLAKRVLLEFSSICALALALDRAEDRSVAVFLTPDGQEEWSMGRLGKGERQQVRTSIVALEHVRRYLRGQPIPI